MEKVLLDKAHVKVYYDGISNLGKVVWNGNPTIEQYKEPYELLINFAKTEKVYYFIADTTNQGIVSPDARKWFETTLVPRAVEVGVKKAAVVSSANAFKKYYINMILSAINKFNIPVKVFSDTESAQKWLMPQ